MDADLLGSVLQIVYLTRWTILRRDWEFADWHHRTCK